MVAHFITGSVIKKSILDNIRRQRKHQLHLNCKDCGVLLYRKVHLSRKHVLVPLAIIPGQFQLELIAHSKENNNVRNHTFMYSLALFPNLEIVRSHAVNVHPAHSPENS